MYENKNIAILGSRGIPARHGGFETFAEQLALYLVKRGWNITVYCQNEGDGEPYEDSWEGIRLIHFPVPSSGALGSIIFDFKSTLHAAKGQGTILTLGYNTAIFSIVYRLKRIPQLINMDGLEWKRQKWSPAARAWLYLNERLACLFANHLIADHPEIKAHLSTRVRESKITMIPYGGDCITKGNATLLSPYGLAPYEYALVIARPEPENSILEIVSAFSRKPRKQRLVVLGNFQPDANAYHAQVIQAASDEVLFPGAIYDKEVVETLRYYTSLYLHGHQVGGTNPSLVEALSAGNPVLAHDNPFNRWVAGEGAHYFENAQGCAAELDRLLDHHEELKAMRTCSLKRHGEAFTWDLVLVKYEALLLAASHGSCLLKGVPRCKTANA